MCSLSQRRRRGLNIALSLISLDFDNFKRINDTRHSLGDKALCFLAEALNSLKREQDIVARLAGDEFVVMLASTEKKLCSPIHQTN